MEDKLEYKITYGKEDFTDARLIRQHVFVEEQGFENEFDEIDEYAYHLVIYQNDEAIATGRMYEKDQETMILGRIATIKECREIGLGSKIVLRLENEAKQLGYIITQLSAQQRAQGFYEKLGYQTQGEVYYDEWCPHVTMKKLL
ncbi:GNAT family N-acetyltransferase [Thomasclavelia cocleata]|uniref:GNAT family N-acetyltransferase n=1 Tax=Thomasclavelia cocleata TaxID=69824 RepID=UPI0024315369|nr:GNAT family N-acetyltransferase [Thomasclavelia cocleata]